MMLDRNIRAAFVAGLTALLLVVVPLTSRSADSGALSLDRPLEYFVHQNPGVTLLIRIVGFETEFESRVFGPDGVLIVTSRLSATRLGVLYQLIEPANELRQLSVKLQPTSKTSNSSLNIELVQLRSNDRESTALIQAYRLLTLGQKAHSAQDSEAGSMGIYALHEAANVFRQLGMEERRLWAVYYAGVKALDTLRDTQSAVEAANFVNSQAQRAGFGQLQLAATLLHGAALSNPSARLPAKTIAANLEEAQRVLEDATRMAETMDSQYQQAWAVSRRGMAYDRAGETQLALQQYLRALELAGPLGDATLTNQVRGDAADASERLGDTQSAVAILGAMNQDLADAGEDEKLSRSLLAQGRMLIGNYQYVDASSVLEQALRLERQNPESGQEGPVGLMLAQAYYHLGRMARALSLLQMSITKTRGSEQRGLVTEALSSAANIHRHRGEYGLARVRRDQQADLSDTAAARALVEYQRLLDLRRNATSDPADVARAFGSSYRAAAQANLDDLGNLSVMQLCSLQSAGNRSGDCTRERVQGAANELMQSGVPRHALEGRHLLAVYLSHSGRTAQAIDQMVRLNVDARFFRSQLPGLLGAWYWENRAAISQQYMSMLLRDPGYLSRGAIDGRQSFAALDQLRNHSRQGNPTVDGNLQASRSDELLSLRSMISEREKSADRQESKQLAEHINDTLSVLRESAGLTDPVGAVDRQLRSLSRGEAVLTYYFDDDDVHVWVGDRKGILLTRIANGRDVQWALTRAGQLLRAGRQLAGDAPADSAPGAASDIALDAALDTVGRGLVEPIVGRLRDRIYFIPAGPISGFPLDAVRVKNRYLAERHEVIHVLSLAALGDRKRNDESLNSLKEDAKMFLAGNPLMSAAAFPDYQGNARELRAVANLFIGPNLHMVQGNALTVDEFADARLSQAAAIHLAAPTHIDLATPANSKIYLSDSRTEPGAEFITANAIRSWSLSADLLVLSSSEMKGINRHSFSNHIALVSELLDAGADSIVCSLWSNEDMAVAAFMTNFYSDLIESGSPLSSLYAVKRQWLKASGKSSGRPSGEGSMVRLWAGFQLYRQWGI